MSLGSCTTRQFFRVLTRRAIVTKHQSTLIQNSLISHGSNQNTQTSSFDITPDSVRIPVPASSDDARLRALLTKGKEGNLANFLVVPKLTSSTIARLYARLRSKPFMQTLTPDDYAVLAKEFKNFAHQTLIASLVEDLLAYFPREHDPAGFATAIAAILNEAVPSMVHPSRTVTLYNAFSAIGSVELPELSGPVWKGIFEAALLYPDECTFTLQSLGEAYLKQTQRTGRFSLDIPRFLSEIITEMLMQGESKFAQALALFRSLSDHQLLPGIDEVPEGSSFKFTVARCLILGHLLANEHVTSIDLVLRLLQDSRWFDPHLTTDFDRQGTSSLALEVLHAVVREPTEKELISCLRLARAIVPSVEPSLHSWDPVDIPDGDVLGLYDHCFYYRRIGDAAALYAYFHSPNIRQRRYYPPPRGPSLFWVFEHFSDPGLTKGDNGRRPAQLKGHLRMAKNILRDVAVRDVPVPLNDRRKFIAVCANRGFAFYTRYFYELWTKEDEPDRNVVLGSGQILVPVVKLFRKLQKTWDNGLAKDKIPRITDGKRSVLPDAWRFANHVVQRYVETKLPINKASQQDINALARAYLVLDRIPEAIQTLSIIMDRGDIPDSKDINIALLAISMYSVPVAVRVLEYMITMGIMPSPSGFSALIHEAFKQGREDIARKLVSRAREMGYAQLTPKGLAALVQSGLPSSKTVKGDVEDRQHARNRLGTLRELLKSVIRYYTSEGRNRDHGKQHLLSVPMGERYIVAALALDEPVLAFEFWKLLVRNRTTWDDAESARLRGLIRSELRKSKLDLYERNRLLGELGEDAGEDKLLDENIRS